MFFVSFEYQQVNIPSHTIYLQTSQEINNWFHFQFGKADHHPWPQAGSHSHEFVCNAAHLKQKQDIFR